ncbi:hypothetical protein KY284_011078 [Solanum tuberosum]|nr:hypothetical protein KY284_011078 [Solanum tuberosum]
MLMHSANHKFDRPGEAEASIQKRRSNNYSQVSDGAAAVLLMKRSIAMQKALPILGVFRYTLCITKKYCKMLTLEILTSSTAHSLSSTIFFCSCFPDAQRGMVIAEAEGHHNASPGPKKIVGVFSKANEYAEMNYNFLGCAENALGIREWLESKGHQYIVTPEKEGLDCGYSGDVWYPQPAPKDHLWRYMPNQAMTPHILGLPLMHRYTARTKDMLDRYFKGEDFPAFGLQVLIS